MQNWDPRDARRAYREQRRQARQTYRDARRNYRYYRGWSGGLNGGLIFVAIIVGFITHSFAIAGTIIAVAVVLWLVNSAIRSSQQPWQQQPPYQSSQPDPQQPQEQPYQPYDQGYQPAQPPQETYYEGGQARAYPQQGDQDAYQEPQGQYPQMPPMQQQ